MNKKLEPLYSVRAAARRLHRNRATIQKAVIAGQIHVVELGWRKLIPESEILRILGRQG